MIGKRDWAKPVARAALGDRVAVVWAGRHRGRARYIVVMGIGAELFDARAFAAAWEAVDLPVPVMLLAELEGWPYTLRGAANPHDLAVDALQCTGEPVAVRGPYRLPGTTAVSFVLSGHFAGRRRRLGLVTLNPAPPSPQEARRIFHWELVTGELGDFVWAAEPPAPTPGPRLKLRHPNAAWTPSEFGEAVLRTATRYEHAGLTLVWVAPHDLGYTYVVRRGDEPYSMNHSTGSWPPPDASLEENALVWDDIQTMSAMRYGQETVDALDPRDGTQLVRAFEQFGYHVRLARPTSPEEALPTIALGMHLAYSLESMHIPYPVEWVTTTCAALAGKFGLVDEQRRLLRHAAISCESMGLAEAALAHYREALDIAEPYGDAVLERNLHVSYATTCAALFAAHEFGEPLGETDRELIAGALDHLDQAEQLVLAEPEEQSAWARMAIPVHHWRLRDLLGERERAAEELRRLADDPAMRAHDQLCKSTLVFWMAALHKQGRPLDEAVERAKAEPGRWGTDRSIVLHAFLASHFLENGEYDRAFLAAETAQHLLVLEDDRIARVPLPGEAYAGRRKLDALEFMCRALALMLKHDALSDMAVGGLVRTLRWYVETAKSRWLTRRLTAGPPGAVLDVDERLSQWAAQMREDLAGHPAALEESQAERLARFSTNDPVRELRSHLPEDSALVSFYETRECSYLFCTTHDATLLMSVQVTQRDLETAVRYLQAGFSGTALHPPIDPDRPFDLAEPYLRPLRDLHRQMETLAAMLRLSSAVVIAPHGAWHNIPLHALLLPELWKAGHSPALCYVPSLEAAVTLFRRRGDDPRRAGLLSHPLRPVEEGVFADSHQRIANRLHTLGLDVDQVFCREATPAEALSMLTRVDLMHILAHGGSPTDPREIMNAGLRLSPGTGTGGWLSAAELPAATMAGVHLTLQACSVGRVVTAASDELWGPVRSALAAGADSVLAPMWNADLHSSTVLIDRFYTLWLGDGLSKAQAFTEAQREMYFSSDHDAWRHLYHWAAFKLMGA
ncbi:CHAT domain-containing protein [Thermoactinospora rubra]|uniref:CHAT domain-containing protein n=1 Tax=Thermoactinospora rubra TaxID=1088767 RepID=UPI000A0F97DB|nr:CHAT domain-containing protein [Thermoactinospora rubra]